MKPLFGGKEKILLIDGHYLLHRCLANPRMQELATEDGVPTGGVFGFLKTLRSTVVKLQGADKTIVAFDGGNSERRVALYSKYRVREPREEKIAPGKGKVEEGDSGYEDAMPYYELFGHQKRYIKDWLQAMGCPTVQFKGKEGDDIIQRIASLDDKYLYVVISDDKDFLQLLSENVHVYRPMADEYFTTDKFKKDFGFSHKKWILYKALTGDTSDKVPGIKGVGPATADEIVKTASKPKEVISFCEGHKLKRFKAVAERKNLKILKRNIKLFDMRKEEFSDDEIDKMRLAIMKNPKIDWGTLRRIADELKLESLAGNLGRWLDPFRQR